MIEINGIAHVVLTVSDFAEPGPSTPGYYSVLFEDPDGIRLEVNFVSGAGVLALGQLRS